MRLAGFILTKMSELVPTALLATLLIFVMVHIAPGDPITAMVGPEASHELVEAIRAQFNLDKPPPTQYFAWLRRIAVGDLGKSIRTGERVTTMIRDRVGVTVCLSLSATLFSIIIAFPAGIVAAVHNEGWFDRLTMFITSMAISLPNFFTAMVMIILCGVVWRILPMTGYVSPFDNFWECLRHLIMPTIALGLIYTALLSRMVRSELLDVLGQDYVRTARSKGLSENLVIVKHALRNSLLPAINLIGLNFASLLGGSVIIEEIFALPGIGRLLVKAILQRDIPVIQGVTLMIAITFIVSSLLVDFIVFLVDPRVGRS